ncbi:MAG: methyltransferase domain-containing protein, partial [Candidatus Omnitrophica bacterium]|nr:methyltransferase domain-containing protein [Candidatus Omnitrophota bacterium]
VDNTALGIVLISADGIIVNRQALENKLRELGVEMNDTFIQAFIIHELTEALAIKRGLSEGAAHTAGLMAEAYYAQNNVQAKSDLNKFWQAREEKYGAWGEKQARKFAQEVISNPLVLVRVIAIPWEHPELDTYIPEASRNFSGIMKRLSIRARANVLNVGSGINPIEPLAGDSYRVYNLENQDLGIRNIPAGFRGDFSDKDFFNLGTPNKNAGPDVILFYNMWVFMGIYGSVGGHANTRQIENAKQYINQALQFIRPGGYIVFVFDFHAQNILEELRPLIPQNVIAEEVDFNSMNLGEVAVAFKIKGEEALTTTTKGAGGIELSASTGRVEIVGGRQPGIEVRSIQAGATSAGLTNTLTSDIIARSFPNEELKPLEREKIAHGRIFIEGPGNTAKEILAMLELFPQLEAIHVADAHYENLEAIQSELNARSDVPHDRIKLHHADLAHLPFADGYFDFSYSSYVYETNLAMNDGSIWSQELGRVLNDAGLHWSMGENDIFFYDSFQARKYGAASCLYAKKPSVNPSMGKQAPGGIDFRALPILIQAMNMPSQAVVAIKGNPVIQAGVLLANGKLDKEWKEIEDMLNGGIIPSVERIKEYLALSCKSADCQTRIDQTLGGVADMFRLEEENSSNSDASLKQILVLLESDRSASELGTALAKVKVSPKEPVLIK